MKISLINVLVLHCKMLTLINLIQMDLTLFFQGLNYLLKFKLKGYYYLQYFPINFFGLNTLD